nr:MAG TPA: hypothetical protein [Bacteriophage sp.]
MSIGTIVLLGEFIGIIISLSIYFIVVLIDVLIDDKKIFKTLFK